MPSRSSGGVQPARPPRGPARPRPANASTAAGSRAQRPQDVERVDVARALPDRVQRRLAVEPRQPALLDVPVAAEALQRLADDGRRPLADPVLADRHRQPAQVALARVERVRPAASPAPSRPRTRPRGRPARCCISGLSASSPPNARRCAAWWVACATAWRISAVDPSTQSSRVAETISMMVRTPRPSAPSRRAQVPSSSTSDEAFDRLPSLSLSRCSRNALRDAVRQHPRAPRSRSARRAPGPARGTGRTSAPSRTTCARSAGTRRRPRAARPGWCWRGRRSRPASRSCPCRPAARPSPRARRRPGSYGGGRQAGLPHRGQGRVGAQGRHRGVGHRHRAAVARLDLRPDHEAGRPADVGACRHRPPTAAACSPAPTATSSSACHDGWKSTSSTRCRSGRGCAAPAGSRWPRRPSAGPPRCRPGEPSAVRPRQVRPARRTARRPRRARGRCRTRRGRQAAAAGSSPHGSGRSRGLP